MVNSCIFCAIAAGEAPARVVHEDERTLAFMDLFPLTLGHALVIPKAHCDSLLDADPEDAAAVMRTAQHVAQAAMRAYEPDGLNLLQTNGAAAMQTVFHLHVHVLPRYVGDGFTVSFTRQKGRDDELDAAAERLRAQLLNPTQGGRWPRR
jgi:histidine triad (HIT) family protein